MSPDRDLGPSRGRGSFWSEQSGGVLLSSILLVGAAIAAYLNAFRGDFQFDDYNVIGNNPAVHSLSAWLADIRGIRPLLKLSYTLNWTSGLGIFGFHLFNTAVHAANTVMVFLLLRRLGDGERSAGNAAADRGPGNYLYYYQRPPWGWAWVLFAGLLFALHPVQTEAVTYISGRSMSLMACFYLGSMLAYIRGRERGSKVWLYLVSPSLFVLALLTKETAVTLPAALLLWEVAGRPRSAGVRSILRAQAGHWAVLLAALAFLAAHPGYAAFLSSNFAIRGPGENLLVQIDGVSYLLSKLVWPVSLNIDPVLPAASGWTWGLAGKALALGALIAAAVVSFGRRPWIFFGVLWFFLHLLPTNSIVPRLDGANERHLYIAAIGLFFAASVELREWSLRAGAGRRVLQAGAAAVLILLGSLTVSRNADYRTEIAMWESSVRADPRNARAFNNLGHAYALAGETGKARRAYQEALFLNPGYDLARRNLAILE